MPVAANTEIALKSADIKPFAEILSKIKSADPIILLTKNHKFIFGFFFSIETT